MYVHHLQVYPDQSGGHHLPPNCFATCSTDGSVRFWNLDSSLPPQWKNAYSKVCVWGGGGLSVKVTVARFNLLAFPVVLSQELLKVIYTDKDVTGLKDQTRVPGGSLHADMYVCTYVRSSGVSSCEGAVASTPEVLCIRFCECYHRHHQGD